MKEMTGGRASQPIDWIALIPEEEWSLYRPVLKAAQAKGVLFAVGGGLAFSAHSARARNTKDMDLFIRPADRDLMVAIVEEHGFTDYYEQLKYDRGWIYRGYQGDIIIDVIWQLANYRDEVDESWLTQGQAVQVRDVTFRLLPAEELIWSKLYVMQRDRCDWPDILNILHDQATELDWARLIERAGPDVPLLGSVVNLYAWLCPMRARQIPEAVWNDLGIRRPEVGPDCDEHKERIDLLDSRDWFGHKRRDGD